MNTSNPKQAITDTSSKLAGDRRNANKQFGFKTAIVGGPNGNGVIGGRPDTGKPQFEDGADDIFG